MTFSDLMSVASFLMALLLIIGFLVGIILTVKIFYDDQKYISKIESEYFLKGIEMEETEIVNKITELDEEQKEYKKKMGFGSSSLEIVGKKYGLKKALETLQSKEK